MKKLIMLLLLISMSVFAGQWDEEEQSYYEGGIKVGFGGSTWIGDDVNDDNKVMKLSYQIGAFFISPVNDQLSFQSELLFDFKGAKYANGNNSSGLDTSYLTVPLLLSFKANDNFKFYGGAYASFLLSATFWYDNEEIGSDTKSITDDFNRFDYGFSVGAMFKNGKLVFDFRYNHGLAKLDNNQKTDKFNQQYMLSFGYLF